MADDPGSRPSAAVDPGSRRSAADDLGSRRSAADDLGSPRLAAVDPGSDRSAADDLGDRYLRRIGGVPAQMWVEPSREQLFWLRRLGRWLTPGPDEPSRLVRAFGTATVVPGTNVTNFSLRYQSYLNDVFHRGRLARIGHAVCMPIVVLGLLAALAPVRLAGVAALPGLAATGPGGLPLNASLPAAVLLAGWWLAWGIVERSAIWAATCVGAVGVLYAAANLAYLCSAPLRYPAHPGSSAQLWSRPYLAVLGAPPFWVAIAALLQAGSHALEPLPPRVSRCVYWMATRDFLAGSTGAVRPARRPGWPSPAAWSARLRRAGALCVQVACGTVDELVASPRLLPVLLMELLWRLGYRPERRDAWKRISGAAIASGNPALDYIGTGGGTPLLLTGDPGPEALVSRPARVVKIGMDNWSADRVIP